MAHKDISDVPDEDYYGFNYSSSYSCTFFPIGTMEEVEKKNIFQAYFEDEQQGGNNQGLFTIEDRG